MQNRQAILFLVLALILGLGAAFTAARWLEGQKPEKSAAKIVTESVVVARMDVPVGTPLTTKQLSVVQWPKAFVPGGAFRSADALEGRVPRRPLASGEPVLEAVLLPQGAAAGLVSMIEPGMRAVSVKVDPVIGVAGFIPPGSRVDVVATLRRIDLKEKLPYTKLILQDVGVLAIDQKLEETRNGEAHLVSVVTLQVTPEQAEKLTYLSHEGRLQLALRNPGDHEPVDTKSTGVADLLPPRWPKKGPSGSPVQVLKGSDVSTKRF